MMGESPGMRGEKRNETGGHMGPPLQRPRRASPPARNVSDGHGMPCPYLRRTILCAAEKSVLVRLTK